jgi:hypothetical protein
MHSLDAGSPDRATLAVSRSPGLAAAAALVLLTLAACSKAPAPSAPAPGTGGGSGAGTGGRPGGNGGSGGQAQGGVTGGGSGGTTGTGGSGTTTPEGSGGSASGGSTGTGDAASPDAAAEETMPTRPAPDGGVPGVGGPVRPCNFEFCESFEGAEGAAPNPQVWTRSNDGLVLSSKMAARGERSLHVPPMTSGQYFIKENKTFPAAGRMNGEIYGRFFLWIERVPLEKPATLYHWTFLEGADVDANTQGWVIRLGGHHRSNGASYVRFNINTHTGEGEDGLFDMVHGFQPKQWYCIEFYFNTPKSEARFWINGQENTMLHWQMNKAGAYTFPTLKAMRFGWAEYQGTNTPYESYIDEIAMDSHPISCDD